MKYVILELLRDKPRHGYEIMKELEQRMHGCYSPSPGSVYPTLQLLEDEELVKAREVAGKKVYEITAAGVKFLEQHRDVVEDIFARVSEAVDQAFGGTMGEVNEGTACLVKAVYRRGWRASDDARRTIAEILARATKEIEEATT
ncbi:MAG TPA: PadR family transcriptional regulator [Gemmatimonadales bacterium]|nr:PadR family transcriptional regulator [Gemmatimonadales bacterium]